ncbi:hypothetical protein [Streptomyces solaniscabiei]|nr:hypothetical protein [Streptomyces solaniscabiei]
MPALRITGEEAVELTLGGGKVKITGGLDKRCPQAHAVSGKGVWSMTR